LSTKTRKSGGANYISEWYSHRMYPEIRTSAKSVSEQASGRCRVLSEATLSPTGCIKADKSKGVCTISSNSNGSRQDWLVCPFRALDTGLLEDASRRLFDVDDGRPVRLAAATSIAKPEARAAFEDHLRAGGFGALFLQSKLGGEISISPSDRSPEMSFDFTMIEVHADAEGFRVGKYGILEVQTMDFHGSYRLAVDNLRSALKLHPDDFGKQVEKNQHWLSEGVEGPNIANVFKRTFYQMMFKFQLGAHPHCAGCIFAIPQAVWDSWQRHLSRPELRDRGDGTLSLDVPEKELSVGPSPAWIYVFDLDAGSPETQSPLSVTLRIATNADALAHYAIKVAPSVAVGAGGVADAIQATIHRRLRTWWPELASGPG